MIISSTGSLMTAQILPQLNRYIFMWWQLHLGCLATIIVSFKSKTLKVAASSIYRGNFCLSKQRGRASEQSSPASVDWDDLSPMKVGVGLFLLGISSGVVSFFPFF